MKIAPFDSLVWGSLRLAPITKIKLMYSVGEGLLPECSVGDPERTTEVEVRIATLFLFACCYRLWNGRLPTGSTNFDDSG